jgi:hypothetical protein
MLKNNLKYISLLLLVNRKLCARGVHLAAKDTIAPVLKVSFLKISNEL